MGCVLPICIPGLVIASAEEGAAEANAYAEGLAAVAVPALHKVYPEKAYHFKAYVINAGKDFGVVVAFVNIEAVAAQHQVPLQLTKQGDLIGKQAFQ